MQGRGGPGKDSAEVSPTPVVMEELRRSLAKADRVAASAYIPRWRAFESPRLDFGVAVVGQVLHHRIVLHNRGKPWFPANKHM